MTILAGASSTVTVPVSIPESVSPGLQTFTLTAENGCNTLTNDKIVAIIKVFIKCRLYKTECLHLIVFKLYKLGAKLGFDKIC